MAKMKKKFYKNIYLWLLVAAFVVIGVVFYYSGNQGFYLVGGASCYTSAGAQTAMANEISFKGFCDGDCLVKTETFCTTDKPYVVQCVGGTQGTCGTNHATYLCQDDSDCSADEYCQATMLGTTCEDKAPTCTLTAHVYDYVTHECRGNGCMQTGCDAGKTCELNLGKKLYECYTVCKTGQITSSCWCEGIKTAGSCCNGDYLASGNCAAGTPDPISNQDNMGGTFSSVEYEQAVAVSSAMNIEGFFKVNAAGNYYIEAKISKPEPQAMIIVASEAPCDKSNALRAGGSQYLSGDVLEFRLSLMSPSEKGKYKLILGAYTACDGKLLESKTYDIVVGNPDSTEPDPVDVVEPVPGEKCTENKLKTCNDGTTITVFNCVMDTTKGYKVYEATDAICSKNPVPCGVGTTKDCEPVPGSEVCRAYQKMNDDLKCKFSFLELFSIDGIKDFYNDNSVIVITAAITLIIILAALVYNKAGGKKSSMDW